MICCWSYSLSINIVLLLYCNASAKCFTTTVSSPEISAIVRANFIVRCTTLVDNVSFLAASAKKFLQSFVNGMSSSICLEVICELDVIEVQANLCCWIFRALMTLSLIVAELSPLILSKTFSISSRGISSTISMRSKSGQEIFA